MDTFLRPEKTVEDLDVRPGELVADFGCGAGYFTIPLAQSVGSKGNVYSFDVRTEALEATRAKSKLFHLLNIDFVQTDLERQLVAAADRPDRPRLSPVAGGQIRPSGRRAHIAAEFHQLPKTTFFLTSKEA